MNCTLTLPQQQQFYAKVFKDLSVIADNQTSYDLKNYINDFYEQVVAASNDTSLGLTYIQLLPRIIGTIINKNPNIRKHFRDNTISTDDVLDLRDSFEDITNVEKYIRVKELTPDKLEQIRKKAGIVGSQLEKASQTDEDLDFQAKHESGLNTTGQEEEVDADGEFTGEADPNPEKITTFAFIRSIIDRLEKQNLDNANSITIEASNGTVVKGVYMIPVTTYTKTGSAITQLTFATLTKDGYKKLFVNERGKITNVEGEDQAEGSLNPMIDFITPNTINGKRDFIFTGTGETSLAPVDELVERVIKNAALNNLEIPNVEILKKQFEEKRAQEVKLVDKFIRTYISDKTQVLPLNIIGGNSGFSLIADPGTKLSEIKLPGSLDIEFGKDGRTYIRVGKYSNKIQVFPEKTSSELAQNVAKLLADPKVTTAVKFGILEKIYNINDDNFNYILDTINLVIFDENSKNIYYRYEIMIFYHNYIFYN
jgi:hypothetical protein